MKQQKVKLRFSWMEFGANFGKVPNIFKGMANSPAVLEGMLKFI